MTSTVVVVGPGAVTAPGALDDELVRTALDCIDDRLAVCDDRIVTVRELWARVAEEATAQHRSHVLLVVPSRWSSARVELVESALLARSTGVTVLRRGDVLRALAPVVVHLDTARTADAVLATVGGAEAVVLDNPTGVGGLDSLARDLRRRLERRGVEVVEVDDDAVRAAVTAEESDPPPRRRLPSVTVIAALAVTATLAGAALRSDPEPETTWLVAGRVAVEVPAEWTVQRVVNGPGSARVQGVSPDGRAAVHVTWASVPGRETHADTARALDAALGRQPDDMFTAFDPDATVAGRKAVTYRETRSDVVDWTVVVEGGVRIAIGCRDGSAEPRRSEVCQHAVRSARTFGEIEGTERLPGAS